MGLLTNRIDKASLKPGDHIYSWRTAYIYAHHGIYVGDNTVIHFTRSGQKIGTGTVLDLLWTSSCPSRNQMHCPTCTPPNEGHGVVSSCIDCFLAGGVLYRFEYSVSPALFLANPRGGTCTLAVSDPEDMVVHRAKYLLKNGFGCYNVFKNNCEHFAMYCKTGLLVLDQTTMGQSGQAVSIRTVLLASLRLVTTKIYGRAATSIGLYCVGAATSIGMYCLSRYVDDIGMRGDVVKVAVEDLTRWSASGYCVRPEGSVEAEVAVVVPDKGRAAERDEDLSQGRQRFYVTEDGDVWCRFGSFNTRIKRYRQGECTRRFSKVTKDTVTGVRGCVSFADKGRAAVTDEELSQGRQRFDVTEDGDVWCRFGSFNIRIKRCRQGECTRRFSKVTKDTVTRVRGCVSFDCSSPDGAT